MLVRKVAINEEQVRAFLESLFEQDLHAKRVLSLSHATLGVVHAASLSVHAIGQALAWARGGMEKHGIKQVDRLLSNEAVDVWKLAAAWVPYVLAERSEALVALDWTDFESDDHTTLVASLVTSHGRTTPLLWMTLQKSALAGNRAQAEDELLLRLKECVPEGVKVTVLADRGFADQRLYALLAQAGFEYVVRFRKDVRVEVEGVHQRSAAEWIPASGHAKKLTEVRVTADRTPVPAVVLVHQKGMKEPWCLATSLGTASARQVVDLYSRRFSCEETFRDIKDLRFGMGLSAVRVKSPERRDRLLLVSALAQVLLTLLGAAGESLGMEKGLKANTVKTRTYSLFRQGCMYYQAIPMMKEERLRPLVERFSELLHGHQIFQEALGFI
ncbi:IS4 family transposase [Myxococcus faecalis]|uniref:IS4 family transposase n=1 Tax=Myxococcus faecalis TaxID=3115646 RepID=UPI003CE6D8B9